MVPADLQSTGDIAIPFASEHAINIVLDFDNFVIGLKCSRRPSLPSAQRNLFGSYRTMLSRSAIRVCQPGPVDFQRAMTSAGNRIVINWRGFVDIGRPPFRIEPREIISGVNSGSSLYSLAATT
jgi:hypothetical protein